MVFEKTKGGAKGVKTFTTQAYSHTCLRLNFDKDNGVPSGKKRMGPFKEGHHLNKGGMKVKQLLELVHVTNTPPKVLANHWKETSITKS
jgi:hypothetical protein